MMKLSLLMCTITTTVIGLLSFAKLRHHIVASLLSLEFASLSLLSLIMLISHTCHSELFISMVYLTISACEGALGLSILVNLMKCHGNDVLKVNNLVQC